jgi:filamentous hemagglutinin family protein
MTKTTAKPELVVRLSGGKTLRYALRPQRMMARLTAVLMVMVGALPAHALDPNALPTNGQVSSGSATVSQAGARMDINQTSQKVSINWGTFNIGSGAWVNFSQPSASAVALNRVATSAGASEIQGRLTSSGQVFLINPNGVLFGKTAQVDVGGLVASTLALSDADFRAGKYSFARDGAAGAILNQGTLNAAEGGYVALLAPEVRNEGVITARLGTVALAAGDKVTLDFTGDRLINLSVDQAALKALAENKRLIQADGGTVILAAKSAGDLAATVVNNDGIIQAQSISSRNGVIRLEGGDQGVTRTAGTLDASGQHTGETGGTIKVLGDKVALLDGAKLDASGDAGGGTILVGGNFQGKGPEQNAHFTYVDRGAQIRADTGTSGNGGKVVVWADDTTRYYGSISARGGATGSDGGNIEVSGKQNLDFNGRIDVAAPNGAGGRVLLDPQDILLNTSTQSSPPNNANGTPDIAFADPPAAGQTTIQISDVTGYSELFLQATRNITVANAVAMGAGRSVRFEANNNITVNAGASIAVTGAGTINLKADADASGGGTLALNAALRSQQGGITLSGASVTSTAAGTITTTGAASQNGGNLSITASGRVNLAGTITANGGTAAANTVGRNAGNVTISGAGITTGTITANGSAGNGAGMAGGAGGTIGLTSTGAVSTGALTASGGAAGTGNAAGGNSGSISVLTTSGNLTTGALAARTGNATGTGAGGTAGTITITDTDAAGTLTTGAINTSGGTSGQGGDVTLSSPGNVSVTGTITTSGAALGTGTTAAGRNAGNVTISGVNRSVTGLITASGGAGRGTNQAGGNAGVVSITGSGALNTMGITAQTGAATGTGAGGTAGALTLAGSTVSAGALTTTGGANGAGGAISATASSGLLNLTGAIAASGGTANANSAGRKAGNVTLVGVNVAALGITANGSAGNGAGMAGGNGAAISVTGTGGDVSVGAISAAGGNAGASGNAGGGNGGTITLDAAGATPTITLGGNLTATGGRRVGSGSAGNGGAVWLKDAATLAGNITVSTAGGTGGGAGGTIQFDGSVDGNTAGTRALTLAAGTGAVSLGGGVGATNALSTVSATGSSIALGSVRTQRTQAYTGATSLGGDLVTLGSAGADTITFNSPVTLTGNSSVTTAGGMGDNIAIGRTINGAYNLALNAGASGNVTTSAGIGQTTALGSFSATGSAVTLAAVRGSSILARSTTGNVTLNGVQTATGGGSSVVIAAAQNFVNNAGASAINAGSGRWLVYSTNPAANAFGGLASGQQALWGMTYTANPPGGIGQSGNRYVFSANQAITYTSAGSTKTYGDDLSAWLATGFTRTGTPNTNTYGGAFLADTWATIVSGVPSMTSAGAATTANAGSYAVNVAQGTLKSLTGYTLVFNSPGTITVNKAALAVTADNKSKTYGDPDPALTATFTGFKNGENSSVLSGLLLSAPAGAAATAGTHAITASGATATNYAIAYGPNGALTVAQAPLTIRADDKSKALGTANPPLTASYRGFKYADDAGSLIGSLALATTAATTSPAGIYPITPSGVTAANYAIAFVDGALTVTAPATTTNPGAIGAITSALIQPAAPAAAPAGGIADFINALPATAAGPGSDEDEPQEETISPNLSVTNCGIRMPYPTKKDCISPR